MLGRDALPQHHRPARAACRRGCSPTIRPTIRAASPPASSTGCCSAPATPSSASIRRPTASERAHALLVMLDDDPAALDIPTQSCVLAHVTTTLGLIDQGAPVDLVFQSIAGTRGRQQELRHRSRAARRGARRGAGARARHGRRQRHVFRDRPGQRALGRRASRRRSADAGSARLCGRARASSRCWSTPSSASSARNISTTASRSSAPGWRIISAASCSACRWASTSATPTTPRPIRTTWTRC